MNLLERLYLRWQLRRVPARLRILHALNAGETTALDISRKYAISSGRLYAHLFRLEHAGQVTSDWRPDGRRGYALAPGWAPVSYSEVVTPDLAARLDHLTALRAQAHA